MESWWPAGGLPGYPASWDPTQKQWPFDNLVDECHQDPHMGYMTASVADWAHQFLDLFSIWGWERARRRAAYKTTLFTQCKTTESSISVAEIQVPRCRLRATQGRQAFQG